MTDSPSPLIEVTDLRKEFVVRDRGRSRHKIIAVDDVSLTIESGETLALVGESGSGKSTLGRCILQMETATAGSVRFGGVDLTSLSRKERRPYQRAMQVIFQDPYSSLSPGRTALQQVVEPIRVLTDDPDPVATATEALAHVGLTGDQLHRVPRHFSGGQRQRIAIARAIAVQPSFIVCDEPVSALDMTIQAQVTSLLQRLQRELGLTYLFISHDLGVVREIATRTAVMYDGRIVELAPTAQLFDNPRHPYTQRLLEAILVPDPAVARKRLQQLSSRVPGPDGPGGDEASQLVEVAPGHLLRS